MATLNDQTNRPKMSMSKSKKRGMSKLPTVWITRPSQKKFEDNYETFKQIGEPGSFGTAYQCKRKSDGKRLAVKQVSKAKLYRLDATDHMRSTLLKSMEAEIDILRRLNHKYIVNMEETYETKHTLHIIMEECKGGELFERIKQRGRYKEADAIPIIRMILEALMYMHDKHRIVHCDLKPDNILFQNADETSNIKIIDFGMSKVLNRLKNLNQLCGTPYYTAPEIIRGQYSHAADMWSVGVIAYVMIFGFPPFYVDPNKYYGIKETKQIYRLILKGFEPVVKSGYGNWFPQSLAKRLGKDGRHFIASLMESDSGNRLTAKEALQHPWIKKGAKDSIESDETYNMSVDATPFANFCTSSKFKYAVCGLFRDQYKNMRPKHFENLKKLFLSMDTDGNGKISYAEFEEGMLKSSVKDKSKIVQMFKELDLDQNGEIVFDSLLDAFVHDYLIASDERLYKAFRDLDKKETGKISLNVLKKKIAEMNVYDDTAHILSIVDDVDTNNDGSIYYEEFLRALHPDFNTVPNWFWKDTMIGDDKKDSESEEVSIDYSEYVKTIEAAQTEHKEDNDMIVKEGWMFKEGKLIRNWKKRYFKLHKNGIMGYYHHQNESKAIATFNVKKMTTMTNKSWGATNKKRYGIKVYTQHRNWKFLCQNNSDRSAWFNAIQTVSGVSIQNTTSRAK